MNDEQIDLLATQFAVKVTEGIVTILAAHEDEAHAGKTDTSWAWRNAHSVAIRDAAADLIRALAGP